MVGPDMCGKTNIIAELSNRTGIKPFKASSEHRAFLGSQKSFLNDLLYADPRVCDFIKQMGVSVLFDRAFPCEYAYSKHFGRKTDIRMLKRVDEMYADLGTKIVVCTRNSFEGIQDDLDAEIDEWALKKISSHYMDFLSWTKCKSMILYVDDENLDREIEEILKFINE